MRLLSILLILIFASRIVIAQIIDNGPKPVVNISPAFTPSYISGNKILSMTIEVSTKEDNGRIKSKGFKDNYFFDAKGKPFKKITITKLSDLTDTSTTYYYYKDKNLTIARTATKRGFTTYYYDYDDKGNLIKEVFCRETNVGESAELFKLGKQEIQYMETYTYEELTPTQTRKKFYNDQGKVFKEGILHYNNKGELIEENIKFSFTGIRINTRYTYDDNKKVLEKNYYSDASGEINETTKYGYDVNQKPTVEQLFRDNKMINETFFFYDKGNRLLEALITKNVADKSILIKNISYIFYQ